MYYCYLLRTIIAATQKIKSMNTISTSALSYYTTLVIITIQVLLNHDREFLGKLTQRSTSLPHEFVDLHETDPNTTMRY